MHSTAPLWKFGEVNPPSVDFKELAEGAVVSFMPLEAVWPGGRADYAGRLAWSNKQSYTQFSRGDILIPKITPTFEAGRTIIAEIDTELGLASTEVHVVRARDNADARFLQYCFQSQPFLDEGASALQGVGNLRRITPRFVQELRVLDVDRDSQQRIADYLDRETGEIDAMIAKMDELARALHVRRRATIESVLEAFPKHRLRLAIAVSQTGPFGTQLSANEYVAGGVPLINPTHIKNSQIHPDYLIGVTKEKSVELSRYLLEPGDIVLGRKGEVDKAALVSSALGPAICGSDSMIIRTNSEICDARFLWWYFQSPNCHQQLKRLAVGAAVEGLNQAAIAQLWMPLPSTLNEQQHFADHLDEVTGKIDAMLAKVAELKSLLTERRAALITDVVTGRKDVA